MRTEKIERLRDLSPESRQELNKQVERVQKEARKLRAQARRLRRTQNVEARQRKKLLVQMAESSKNWGQVVARRGGDLAGSGIAQAGSQLRSGQQKARKYGGNLVQGVSQLGSQATQNLSDWSGDTSSRLLKQGQQLSQGASKWGDDTAYRLRKQGRSLLQTAADWGEEMAYRLRRRGRELGRTLVDRKEDATHQISHKQRDLGRNLAERREDTTRQLRRGGRKLGRNLSERRDDAARQIRKQREALSERGEQLLKPVRGRGAFWSIVGFASGVLVAGGITYWLIKRVLHKDEEQAEDAIELEVREGSMNGIVYRGGREIRPASRAGTAVVIRYTNSAGPATRFAGVLSSRRYYPLESKPDVQDLVFFDSEEDARAEGFESEP